MPKQGSVESHSSSVAVWAAVFNDLGLEESAPAPRCERRRGKGRRIAAYAWLGAGAVTLGMGAALVGGFGGSSCRDRRWVRLLGVK